MNFRIGAALLAVAVTAAAADAAPVVKPTATPVAKATSALSKYQQQQREKFKNSAPADEYFGRLKLSYLGMNNTFHDSVISSGEHTTDPAIINKLTLAEDALKDWERKYPHDPQLPRTYYLAIAADKRVWTKTNQDLAWQHMNRIVSVFPTTYFGKIVKKNLAIGFTEHYFAPALPCATPAPDVADQRVKPAAFISRDATPSAAPSPVSSPGPVVSTIGKGHNVQLEVAACIPPPTPAPVTPSPNPAATAVQPSPAPKRS